MHGGKSLCGIAHPRFKHGRHCATFPFCTSVCPKCRRTHGTPAEKESRERARSAAFLRAYEMGYAHGRRDETRGA
jgi:hypothetical protein